MDLKIGVIQTPKEIAVELEDGIDAGKLRASIEGALSGKDPVLWVTDRTGRVIGIASERIAYVEIGTPDTGRKVGFGG